ncbi:glycoside hydrolase family 97 catalytic domain-containing protein [Bacteroides ovatus]|nr:glycoside hydrolase family 97 catalytic domain-containing protein [Bacteroides ovatus]
MDFTFGTFNFTNEAYPGTRVNTTLCKQLALFVVIYSPLQMVLRIYQKTTKASKRSISLRMYLPTGIKLM